MYFSDDVFVGEKIKNAHKVLEKVNKGKCFKTYYFICFFNDSGPEILPSYLFLQKYFRSREYEAVALFKSEYEAFEYIRVLTDYSYKMLGRLDYKAVLEKVSKEDIERNFEKEDD